MLCRLWTLADFDFGGSPLLDLLAERDAKARNPLTAHANPTQRHAMMDGVILFPKDYADLYRAKGYWQDQPLREVFHAWGTQTGLRCTTPPKASRSVSSTSVPPTVMSQSAALRL